MEKLSFTLETFEGPLDLLLHLISKNKLNIYDIHICELVEQYLKYIGLMRENSMEVSSEFLEMASRLVYIKSASLLPRNEEADTLRDELSGDLIQYQTVRELAKKLSEQSDGFLKFVRGPDMPSVDHTYLLTHESSVLIHWYLSAAGRGMRKLPPSKADFAPLVKRTVIPVSSKIVFILRRLWKGAKVKYRQIFENVKSRSEAVATFLAVLELIKAQRVELDDAENLKIIRK